MLNKFSKSLRYSIKTNKFDDSQKTTNSFSKSYNYKTINTPDHSKLINEFNCTLDFDGPIYNLDITDNNNYIFNELDYNDISRNDTKKLINETKRLMEEYSLNQKKSITTSKKKLNNNTIKNSSKSSNDVFNKINKIPKIPSSTDRKRNKKTSLYDSRLNQELINKNNEISKLKSELKEKNNELENLKKNFENYKRNNKLKNNSNIDLENKIKELEEKNYLLCIDNCKLQKLVNNNKIYIENKEEEINDLKQIISNIIYKMKILFEKENKNYYQINFLFNQIKDCIKIDKNSEYINGNKGKKHDYIDIKNNYYFRNEGYHKYKSTKNKNNLHFKFGIDDNDILYNRDIV